MVDAFADSGSDSQLIRFPSDYGTIPPTSDSASISPESNYDSLSSGSEPGTLSSESESESGRSSPLMKLKTTVESDSETRDEEVGECESEPGEESDYESELEEDSEGEEVVYKSDPDSDFEFDSDYDIPDDILCKELLANEYPCDESAFERPPRSMTRKERKLYGEQLKRSGGFDMGYFPNVRELGMILPAATSGQELVSLIRYAKAAIKNENKKRTPENKLKLIGIVKTMWQACGPLNYYFTLKAQEKSTGKINVYESLVNRRIRGKKTNFAFFLPQGEAKKLLE